MRYILLALIMMGIISCANQQQPTPKEVPHKQAYNVSWTNLFIGCLNVNIDSVITVLPPNSYNGMTPSPGHKFVVIFASYFDSCGDSIPINVGCLHGSSDMNLPSYYNPIAHYITMQIPFFKRVVSVFEIHTYDIYYQWWPMAVYPAIDANWKYVHQGA